jgi:hypothetical protein
MFALNPSNRKRQHRRSISNNPRPLDLPYISNSVTIGRNSTFHNLTAEDRERLGGIEYRALKLLLKIVTGSVSPVPTVINRQMLTFL